MVFCAKLVKGSIIDEKLRNQLRFRQLTVVKSGKVSNLGMEMDFLF